MREYFDAPNRDRYQIITEHKRGQIIAEETGLGFERTDDIVIVQIFQQGRTRRKHLLGRTSSSRPSNPSPRPRLHS